MDNLPNPARHQGTVSDFEWKTEHLGFADSPDLKIE